MGFWTARSLLLACFAGSRGEEVSEEDPQIDIATVQDMLSSHHYKSFKVSMIHRLRFTTDVQLGKSIPTVTLGKMGRFKALAISNSCLSISGVFKAVIIMLVCFIVEHITPKCCYHFSGLKNCFLLKLCFLLSTIS